MHCYASPFFLSVHPPYHITAPSEIRHLTCKYNVLILWSKRDNSKKNIDQNTFITTMCEDVGRLNIFFDEVVYDHFWPTFVTMDAFA